MVSSRSPGVNVSPANSVATSRAIVSDSDVARDGDAILPDILQSYPVEVEGDRVDGVPGDTEWSQNDSSSLSMSVDLQNLVSPNIQESGNYSASLIHTDAATFPRNGKSAQSHEEEESYEAFGSVEGDADDGVDSPGGSSSAPSPTDTSSLKNPRSPNSTIGRHSWLRTSLRRTPPCSGRKRLSSNALASQLYRSGSFNSSGRGSNCDPADDMYSDVSLEDDVIDLNHRMCATHTPCRSSTQSGSPVNKQGDNVRYHHQYAAHPPPYIYYPPPYPPANPYGHYPYHPGGLYSPGYCNDITNEPRGVSWLSIVLLIFLLLCIISIIFYRSLSRDTRRRLNARLPTLMQPVQTVKRKRDAIQNYPAECILYSDVTDPLNKDYNIFCEKCDDHRSMSSSGSMKLGNYSICERDGNRKENVIDASTSHKVNVATGISSTSLNDFTRSAACDKP